MNHKLPPIPCHHCGALSVMVTLPHRESPSKDQVPLCRDCVKKAPPNQAYTTIVDYRAHTYQWGIESTDSTDSTSSAALKPGSECGHHHTNMDQAISCLAREFRRAGAPVPGAILAHADGSHLTPAEHTALALHR